VHCIGLALVLGHVGVDSAHNVRADGGGEDGWESRLPLCLPAVHADHLHQGSSHFEMAKERTDLAQALIETSANCTARVLIQPMFWTQQPPPVRPASKCQVPKPVVGGLAWCSSID
jgi:hypothetical protein